MWAKGEFHRSQLLSGGPGAEAPPLKLTLV